MSWQAFLSDLASDARARAITQLAPLVLRQVGGLLTDTASRLETYEPTGTASVNIAPDVDEYVRKMNWFFPPPPGHPHPRVSVDDDVITRLREFRREARS